MHILYKMAYQLRVHPEGAGGETLVDIADMHTGAPRSPNGNDSILQNALFFTPKVGY